MGQNLPSAGFALQIHLTHFQAAHSGLTFQFLDLTQSPRLNPRERQQSSCQISSSHILSPREMAFSQLNEESELEPIIYLSVDILKIEQVIRNLLSNAIKFTASGRITVTATIVSDQLSLSSEKVRCCYFQFSQF